MPHRTLGKTGESVSCIGLGGFHLGLSRLEEADAIKLFQTAIDRGIFPSFDLQYMVNPGYNRDRGPVLVPGLRLHFEF